MPDTPQLIAAALFLVGWACGLAAAWLAQRGRTPVHRLAAATALACAVGAIVYGLMFAGVQVSRSLPRGYHEHYPSVPLPKHGIQGPSPPS